MPVEFALPSMQRPHTPTYIRLAQQYSHLRDTEHTAVHTIFRCRARQARDRRRLKRRYVTLRAACVSISASQLTAKTMCSTSSLRQFSDFRELNCPRESTFSPLLSLACRPSKNASKSPAGQRCHRPSPPPKKAKSTVSTSAPPSGPSPREPLPDFLMLQARYVTQVQHRRT